jgi:Uma2 family endonuclease
MNAGNAARIAGPPEFPRRNGMWPEPCGRSSPAGFFGARREENCALPRIPLPTMRASMAPVTVPGTSASWVLNRDNKQEPMNALRAPSTPQFEPFLSGASFPSTRLFTAEEYQRMAELGVIGEDEPVELIEGSIVRMAAKNHRHAMATKRVNRLFSARLADSVIVSVQDPVLLNDLSEPEPDVALIRPPDERYIENHPRPEDVLLVLEIADSSLSYDRDVKCPLFARNGIIQCCLLNLPSRELEDYRDPSPEGYRSKRTYAEDETFNLVAFPKLAIRVKDLLPPIATRSRRRKR